MSATISLNKKSSSIVFECAIAFSLSLIYFYGITLLARTTVLFEVFFCIVIPFLIFYLNKYSTSTTPNRVMQLIFIESYYMLCVVFAKISIIFQYDFINSIISYGFLSFAIIQITFFMIYQHKVASYLGLIRSLMFIVLIFYWFHQVHLDSVIDSQGRFLMWGEEAPTHVIIYYCFWVVGVLLADSRTLPNFITAVFHFSSVSVAVWSQEFFHVRLLTASHLFILDSLFHFSDKDKSNPFCIASGEQYEFYQQHIRKMIDYVTLIGCISIFIMYFSVY